MVEIEEIKESFLPFVALFVPDHPGSYGMRFEKEEHISAEKEIEGSFKDEIQVLSFKASHSVTDATLLKRPWVRLERMDDPVEWEVRFVLDGETVADGGLEKFPVEDRLGGEPYGWRSLKQYWASKMERPDQTEVMNFPRIGLMMPNGSRIQAFIRNAKASRNQKIRIEAGIVAALYSTKAV
jgi:hypothetical protein